MFLFACSMRGSVLRELNGPRGMKAAGGRGGVREAQSWCRCVRMVGGGRGRERGLRSIVPATDVADMIRDGDEVVDRRHALRAVRSIVCVARRTLQVAVFNAACCNVANVATLHAVLLGPLHAVLLGPLHAVLLGL